jgi:hypothetical protein
VTFVPRFNGTCGSRIDAKATFASGYCGSSPSEVTKASDDTSAQTLWFATLT